jgi:Domain of unknown function (DUF3597)
MPLFNSEWGALSRPLMHDSEVDYDPDVPTEPEERPVMSIFGDIMSAIFGSSAKGGTPAAKPAAASPSSSPSATSAPSAKPAAAPAASVDVAAVLDALAKKNKQKLHWRTSIVDLMKLLDLDSSRAARKKLAGELHYSGDTNDSPKMNVWLHKQVMIKLAANGGKVPEELKH